MSDQSPPAGGAAGRHATATTLAEQAVQAEARGDDAEADRLFAEAARIDPEAVNAVLDAPVTTTPAHTEPQTDAEIAAMTRTVEPEADAPTRSGIGGPGSGADSQAR